MKHSSYFAYYFLKFAGIGFLAMGLILLHAIIFPNASVVEGFNTESSTSDTISAIAFLPIIFAVAYFTFFRIRVIRYDDYAVEVLNGSKLIRTSWGNVRNVSKVIGCAPPIYRMSFKDETQPAYFIMSMFFFVYVAFWSWDFTGFYKYAKEKIAETRNTP
jgi:hypothetical protein